MQSETTNYESTCESFLKKNFVEKISEEESIEVKKKKRQKKDFSLKEI